MRSLQPYVVLSILLLAGCEPGVNENESFDYSIDQRMNCYCPQGGKWVRLFVRDDTIVSVRDISTGYPLLDQRWIGYKSIRGLFDTISATDTSLNTLVVEMDPKGNYPSYVSISPRPVVIDDSTVVVVVDGDVSYSSQNYVEFRE